MALVFKIKFNDTLRRWVICEELNSTTFSLTLTEVEAKIRELFQISPSSSLIITYVDKDNDVVTLGDDQDLVDACIVQHLNPLRLNVDEKSSSVNTTATANTNRTTTNNNTIGNTSTAARMSSDPGIQNIEGILKTVFPQATTDALHNFVKTHSQYCDPLLPTDTLIQKAQEAFKQFLNGLTPQQRAQDMPDLSQSEANPTMGHIVTNKPHSTFIDTHAPGLASLGSRGVFHRRVQCDGCGMYPIEGIRYKSTKVHNYDLCSGCYTVLGNDSDFQRLEHPIHPVYRPPFLRRGLKHVVGHSTWRGSSSRGPYGLKSECPFSGQEIVHSAPKEPRKKLDSRFVKDVTIFDGTELLPRTNFTKIWRMRNSGNLPWPQGTQLTHIGGDTLSSIESVNLELPEAGLQCGEDIEISVDLVAPDRAGRYVSHWRLVSPSGQKFGHRVWVLILVVVQVEESPQREESLKGHEKMVEVEQLTLEVQDVSLDEMDIDHKGRKSDKVKASSNNAMPTIPMHDADAEAQLEMEVELDGFSLIEKPVEHISEENGDVTPETVETILLGKGKMVAEENCEGQLELLESMGFINRDLNRLLLNKNNGHLQDTLDDLLLSTGWEGVLKDLNEMGFTDQTMNICLLLENKGSIKQVVKDLVRMEKEGGRDGRVV